MNEETPLQPTHGLTGRPPAHKRWEHGTQRKTAGVKRKYVQMPWNRAGEGPLVLCPAARDALRELRQNGHTRKSGYCTKSSEDA